MPFGAGGPVTDYKMDVGPGWSSLLDQLDAELKAIDPDYQTVQVKEKFGNLRVYIEDTGPYPGLMWDVLGKYERLSSEVCEECGQPGTHDNSRYWIKTLCPACTASRAERNREAWAARKSQ